MTSTRTERRRSTSGRIELRRLRMNASLKRCSLGWAPLFVWAATAGPACTSSVGNMALRAAERGDEHALREVLATAQTSGTLSNGDAATLARVVADREIRTASPEDAVARVHDVAPCAHELDDTLAARMRTHDAAGARAALARVDGGVLDADEGRPFLKDMDAPWRAFGVRALTRPDENEARRRALLNPDPLVRREAALATRDAARRAEPEFATLSALSALSEAARVDPEPIVRTEALRAIAVLPATPNGEVAGALRDLWTSGDDGLREDIAVAWSRTAVWDAGGRDALHVLVASEHGPGAIEAAAAVLRRPDADDEIARAAVGQLARAIQGGPPSARLHALGEAPLERGNLLASVRAAASDDDLQVRVVALSRLLGAGVSEGDAGGESPRAALEALAQPGSTAAASARSALARAGDRRVQAWLEEDLRAPRAEERLAAAAALAAMGRTARAAPLLADVEPRVRVRAACSILLASRVAR